MHLAAKQVAKLGRCYRAGWELSSKRMVEPVILPRPVKIAHLGSNLSTGHSNGIHAGYLFDLFAPDLFGEILWPTVARWRVLTVNGFQLHYQVCHWKKPIEALPGRGP